MKDMLNDINFIPHPSYFILAFASGQSFYTQTPPRVNVRIV